MPEPEGHDFTHVSHVVLLRLNPLLHCGRTETENTMTSDTTPLNAAIGDAGFYATFGWSPGPRDRGNVRIRSHFDYVVARLRNRDCSELKASVRARRERCIELLEGYRDAGVFPVNSYLEDRTPVFIDAEGRLCAVGYLIAQTAGLRASEEIAAAHRLSLIEDIDLPIIDAWAADYGFERHELAMIQPNYDWAGAATIVESSMGWFHWLRRSACFPL